MHTAWALMSISQKAHYEFPLYSHHIIVFAYNFSEIHPLRKAGSIGTTKSLFIFKCFKMFYWTKPKSKTSFKPNKLLQKHPEMVLSLCLLFSQQQ